MANIENKDLNKESRKRMVKALFSYTAENVDELHLKINDVLEVIEETEEGWWKGAIDGKVGMFPSNFVKELNDVSDDKVKNEQSPVKNIQRNKNFIQQETDKQVNMIFPLKQGTMNSNSEVDGAFISKGSSDVALDTKVLKKIDSSAPRLPPKPIRELAQVLFPYEAQNEDELSLREGDVITVISKEVEDKGWWKGELNNNIGVFPDNFVKIIKAEEQKKPERPDKPSSVLTSARANLKSVSSERKNVKSEFSPKLEKKLSKTPPAKPPPPEIHKKESERPLPPCPTKKPQLPNAVPKPLRLSGVAKVPVFPIVSSNSSKSSIVEYSPSSTKRNKSSFAEKSEDSDKSSEKLHKKDDKDGNVLGATPKEEEEAPEKITQEEKDKKDSIFDALEVSTTKLVHLTANRAKAPNRRPPSCIFLKEQDKETVTDSKSTTDSRRLSEPLLDEMKFMFLNADAEEPKVNTYSVVEIKPKTPPTRPVLPVTKTTSSINQDVVNKDKVKPDDSKEKDATSTITDTKNELEVPFIPKKDAPQHKIIQPMFSVSVKQQLQETETASAKGDTQLGSSVFDKYEENALMNEVHGLKELIERYNSTWQKAISELRAELEEEKRLRRSLEQELKLIKESKHT